MILAVNDVDASVAFYTDVLGCTHDGSDGPFEVVRFTDDFMILLAAAETDGGQHLAFETSREEFEEIWARLKERRLEYGDSFHNVGSMTGPGRERGAHGIGPALYFWDPSRHLLEIRYADA
jgi:catechol 2,3-dioxygenase-like lactoylglutathione lyase family enzyme